MSVINKCFRLGNALREDTEESIDRAAEMPHHVGTLMRWLGQRGVNFIRDFGPAGEELAHQVEEVVRPAMARAGTQTEIAMQSLKGLNRPERELVAQIVDKQVPESAAKGDARVLHAAQVIRDRLDVDMNASDAVGMRRRLAPGVRAPIKGSGHAFPTELNRAGRQVLEEAHRLGLGSGKVKALVERMVSEGRAESEDMALEQLRRLRDRMLRGTNHYIESVRTWLPPELREWDPRSVLPRTFKRNAFTLEGVRRWGDQFEALNGPLSQLSRESGAGAAEVTEQFIKYHFGVAGRVPLWHQRVANAWSNWETVSKLSGIFSPILNFGQRFTNTADAPIIAQLRALKDLPPVANTWMKSAELIKSDIRKTGAISGMNPLTELARQGPVARKISQIVLSPFGAVARGNEYYSALVGRYALEADMEALGRVAGADNPLSKMWQAVRHLAIDPQGAIERRIARRGIDPQEAMGMLQRGERITADQYTVAMQKAIEDDQFALNALTEQVWWGQSPWMRLAFKFKTFGVRQVELIYNRVAHEAMLGNFAPGLKFLAATALMGEAYHLSRDLISGSDLSAVSLLKSRDPSKRNPQEVAARIASDFVAQGGVGMMADLHYGIGNFVQGPAGSSARNVLDAAINIELDPRQTLLALRSLASNEVVPARQAGSLLEQARQHFAGQTDRYRQYHQLRSAAYNFANAKGQQTFAAKTEAAVLRAMQGQEAFQPTARSLRYRYSAAAITANDVDQASSYLSEIFSTATTPAELKSLMRGVQSSMRRQAPMGNLSEQDRRRFLALMPPADRMQAQRLRSVWIRDYERAIQIARQKAAARSRQQRRSR